MIVSFSLLFIVIFFSAVAGSCVYRSHERGVMMVFFVLVLVVAGVLLWHIYG